MSLHLVPYTVLVLVGFVAIALLFVSIRRPMFGIQGLILICLFAPLYPVPGFEYIFYVFALFSSFLLLVWLALVFRRVQSREAPQSYRSMSRGIKNWLLMCLLGLPLSLLFNRGHVDERLYYFVKGFLPFWYLCSFFIVWRFRPQFNDAANILRAILITAAGFGILSWGIYFATGARVTWLYHPLAFPFIVLGANIAFVYFLASEHLYEQLAWAGLVVFFVAGVVFTFTKAQMIALLGGFILGLIILQGPSHPSALRRATGFCISGLLIAIVLAFIVAHNEVESFTDMLSARITDAGTTNTRLEEWHSALVEFAQSPLIGKGIGFQLQRTEFDETITAGYVHNQVIYTAMTMGIIGLAIYSYIVWKWILLIRKSRYALRQTKSLLAASHACIMSLFIYSLLFAAFRTIQHNYLLGVLFALTVTLTPQTGSDIAATMAGGD